MSMRASTALYLIAAALLGGTSVDVRGAATIEKVWLSDLDISKTQQSWGEPRRNASVDGNPLRIGGRAFEHGLGTFDSRFGTEVPRHGVVVVRFFPVP